MSAPTPEVSPCPCGAGRPLASCCGPLVHGVEHAATAEALMRSRYTAYALGTPEAVAYLVATHHPDFREHDLARGIARTVAAIDAWEGLVVRSAHEDGDRATVEFTARFRQGRDRSALRERSRFVREGGRWAYTDGDVG